MSLNAASQNNDSQKDNDDTMASAMSKSKCFFCGDSRHIRQKCPAKDVVCHNCGKTGHFSKVFQSKKPATAVYPTLESITSAAIYPSCLQKTILQIEINNHSAHALIDTGSSDSFICNQIAKKLCSSIHPVKSSVSLAESSISVDVIGYAIVKLCLQIQNYRC